MDAAVKMQLFQNLFYVSVAITVIGFGLAIFFFFYFDIRNVRALMTGKAKRETVQRMAEQNARTGALRGPMTGSTRDPSIPIIQHPSQAVTADIQNTAQLVAPAPTPDTTVLVNSEETTLLRNNEDTMVLAPQVNVSEANMGCGETTILTAPAAPAAPAIRFDITESTLVIHTNEII